MYRCYNRHDATCIMTELTKHDICRQTSSEPLPVDCRSAGQVTQLCVDHTANSNTHNYRVRQKQTRHTASTSMYSLTFCARVMSPERHHWKPAVQAATVMLRTPPLTASHRPASHAYLLYMARNFENASVTCWSLISNARTPRVN